MIYLLEEEFIEWANFWDSWHKWASQKPSPWHPIKYIKWLRSEPKCKTEQVTTIPLCEIYIPTEKGKKK